MLFFSCMISEAQFWARRPAKPFIVVEGVNSTEANLVWEYSVPTDSILAVNIKRTRQGESSTTPIASGAGRAALRPTSLRVSDPNLQSKYRASENGDLKTYTLQLLNVNNAEEYEYTITVTYQSPGTITADDSVLVDVKGEKPLASS